jgi:hypothetical protein
VPPPPRPRSEIARIARLAAGVALMIFGPIIGLPTPGPLGFLLFGLGLALVLRNSQAAKRRYVRMTRRHPRLQRAVNFGLRRRQGRAGVARRADRQGAR